MTIKAKKLNIFIIVTAVLITIYNIVDFFLGSPVKWVSRMFLVGIEANIPTWLSSFMLLMAAFYMYQISVKLWSDPNNKKRLSRVWQVISIMFLAMSIDETAMIHETIGHGLRRYVFHAPRGTTYDWMVLVPAVVIFVIFILWNIKYFEWKAPGMMIIVVGGILFITGGMFFDVLEKLISFELSENVIDIFMLTEELFEIYGLIVLIIGLEKYYEN